VNARDENLPREISELSIFGEQLCVLAANPVSGAVRLGYVDPQWIESVEYASLEALPGRAVAMPIAVNLTRVAGERDQKRLPIVHRDEDPYSPTYGQLIGEAMYFAVNRARAASRGISDLFASTDMIDAHESTLWALVNRADMAGRFIYDVELTGMTEEQIAEWLKKNGKPPAPGAIRAHNERAKWTLPSYQVGAGDSGETTRGVRVHVLGSRGVPEHWYGSGADANLATATAQGEPIIKMLGRRARYVKAMEQAKAEYVIDRKIAAGVLPESVNRKFEVVMPELSVRDLVKASSALAQIAAAVAGLQGAEVMDKRTAARAVAAVLPQVGVDGVDPDEMMAAAAAEAEQRKSADYVPVRGPWSQVPGPPLEPEQEPKGAPIREDFDPDQPRDDEGQWTSGGGGGGGAGSAASGRAARAVASHKPVTLQRRRHADLRQADMARFIGGRQTGDNEPFDVIRGRSAIEVKTLIDQRNDKITMHPDSLARKQKDAKRFSRVYTLVVDDRPGSGGKLYLREGLGSFRLGAMQPISRAELARKFKG
jgi:hypothetical protein